MLSRIRGNGFTLLSFIVIGGANALIDIGVFNALLILHPVSNENMLLLYHTVAYVAAVTNSYIWNSRITFYRKANYGVREKIRFALQAGLALFVSNGVFLLGIRSLSYLNLWEFQHRFGYNAVKVLAMLFSACSFLMMKYMIFTSANSRERAGERS